MTLMVEKQELPFRSTRVGKKAQDHKVYYVADNGEMTLVPSAYADKHMIIETDHFSEYVIVYEGESEVEESAAAEEAVTEGTTVEETTVEETTVEKAGTPILPIIIIIAVIAVAGAAYMTVKKKTEDE